jgi:hypothetical protein
MHGRGRRGQFLGREIPARSRFVPVIIPVPVPVPITIAVANIVVAISRIIAPARVVKHRHLR